jgi:ABC-type glutathione transport system ATPase component
VDFRQDCAKALSGARVGRHVDNDHKKLSVRDVCKTFRLRGNGRGEKDRLLPVLRNVSFDVREGEIVSLVGESGCGKTTLLRIIQGLVRLDSGSVMVDGAPIVAAGRDRGFAFQLASLALTSIVRKVEDMSAPWRAHDE